MAAAALKFGRPIRIEAIAGPAIDKARLVDGAKAQEPNAARPYDRTRELSLEGRDRGIRKPNAKTRDWSVAKTAGGFAKAQRQSHPCDRRKAAKGNNPTSDAGRDANSSGEAATGPMRTWDTGMKKSPVNDPQRAAALLRGSQPEPRRREADKDRKDQFRDPATVGKDRGKKGRSGMVRGRHPRAAQCGQETLKGNEPHERRTADRSSSGGPGYETAGPCGSNHGRKRAGR